MNTDFFAIMNQLLPSAPINEVMNMNPKLERFGLTITKADAQALVVTRNNALSANGRVELGSSIIDKLMFAFCDSDFINQDNFVDTMNEMIELFYYFKNEMNDKISDEELINLMKMYFEKICYGSLELLYKEMDQIATDIRFQRYDFTDLYREAQKEPLEEEEYNELD